MPPPKPKGDYIETDTGNKVARRAQLHGTQHIILAGRSVIQPEVCIRGDLIRLSTPSSSSSASQSTQQTSKDSKTPAYSTSVTLGRYTFISTGSILRPPYRLHRGTVSYHPLKIGDHVFVADHCVIEAASIGDHVHVGQGAVLGRMCIVKDYVKILEGAVVPAGMVVPSGSVVGGRPGRVVGEVGEGWGCKERVEGGDLRERWRAVR